MKSRGRKRPSLRWFLGGSLLVVGLLSWVVGCATIVEPPPGPSDPVTAFLLDHGHTSSLVLPAEGGWVRYAHSCIFHDSNQVAANWLAELGCRVRGMAILSRWDLRPAGEPPGPPGSPR